MFTGELVHQSNISLRNNIDVSAFPCSDPSRAIIFCDFKLVAVGSGNLVPVEPGIPVCLGRC